MTLALRGPLRLDISMGKKIQEVSRMIVIRDRDAWHIAERFQGNPVPPGPLLFREDIAGMGHTAHPLHMTSTALTGRTPEMSIAFTSRTENSIEKSYRRLPGPCFFDQLIRKN